MILSRDRLMHTCEKLRRKIQVRRPQHGTCITFMAGFVVAVSKEKYIKRSFGNAALQQTPVVIQR